MQRSSGIRVAPARKDSNRLLRPAAEIIDQADLAARLARKTRVAAVQDQPVMRVPHELWRHHLLEPELNFERRIARREGGAVTDSKNMGVDRHGVLAERHIEHDVRSLAAGARQV